MQPMDEQLIAIIPAAGKGSRLAPLPTPKELFPIGYQDYRVNGTLEKRPKVISQYLVENIRLAGAQRILIVLGEDKYDIMRYYGDGHRFGVDIAYLFQEELRGMPLAINLARQWIAGATVLFGMPDTIIEPKDAFTRLVAFGRRESADLALGLFLTDCPSKFGMVEVDSHGDVACIVDKPSETSLRYMWGCASWSPAFTDLLDEYIRAYPLSGRELVLGDVFQHAVDLKMRVKGLRFDEGQYIDIGTTNELDTALKRFHL